MSFTLDFHFSFKTISILTNKYTNSSYSWWRLHVPKFRSFRPTSPSKNLSKKWSTPLCQKQVPTSCLLRILYTILNIFFLIPSTRCYTTRNVSILDIPKSRDLPTASLHSSSQPKNNHKNRTRLGTKLLMLFSLKL